MAIKKAIVWRHQNFNAAVIVVNKPAETYNSQIIIDVYSNADSLSGGETPLYQESIYVPDNIMATLFTEDALKVEGVTARSQTYLYIKTLPEYSDSEDLML